MALLNIFLVPFPVVCILNQPAQRTAPGHPTRKPQPRARWPDVIPSNCLI